jgi:hypothetical protein
MTNWDASERLAARVEERAGDLSSGHERWRIYRRAIEMPRAWDELLTAMASEPDQAIASAVVVQLLERVPPEMRNAVVGVLADGKGRDFAALRSRELGILESLSDGEVDNVHEHIDSWSTWLQLRAAGESAEIMLRPETFLDPMQLTQRWLTLRGILSHFIRRPMRLTGQSSMSR